jgi:hypothetical protein
LSTIDRGDGAPDAYFLPGYVAAASIAENGEPAHIDAYDGAWQMPLIVRRLADGVSDAITPTFSGIYASPELSADDRARAWSAGVEEMRQRGIISLVVRGSACVPQATDLPGLRPISIDRPTIVLDLADHGTAWDGLRSTCRTRIRKAEKSGYSGRVRKSTPSDLVPGSDFRRLYEQTMHRVQADPVYFFPDTYYEALFGALGPALLISEVVDSYGEVVSACLLIQHGGRMHYHLAGSRREDARAGTNNLMMWLGIRFAIDKGLKHFHLGAGATARDSVFRFKATFGGREAAYDVSGAVIDEQRYGERVGRRAQECGVTVEVLEGAGFFPAYRAAPPASQPKSST